MTDERDAAAVILVRSHLHARTWYCLVDGQGDLSSFEQCGPLSLVKRWYEQRRGAGDQGGIVRWVRGREDGDDEVWGYVDAEPP